MIDLHCHILPGVDDGAADPDTACRMAALAADCGVRYICATPHCNTRDSRKNYRSPELERAFAALNEELDRWRIPVRVLPGAEVLARSNLEELLDRGALQTLNNSRYLLVEFYFDEVPEEMTRRLEAVARSGLVPVIAHPERYFAVQDRPFLALGWAERGWPLQLNQGSILGDLGEGAYDAAGWLLRRHAASVLASDAHDALRRSPRPDLLREELEQRFPQLDPEELLRHNPMKILKNLELG